MIIYSTKTCPACKQLKADLFKRNIPYTDIDITKIPPEEQATLNIRSVPTVIHKGKLYSGIDIKELL